MLSDPRLTVFLVSVQQTLVYVQRLDFHDLRPHFPQRVGLQIYQEHAFEFKIPLIDRF